MAKYNIGDSVFVNKSCTPDHWRGLIGNIIGIDYDIDNNYCAYYEILFSNGRKCTMVGSDICPYSLSPTNSPNNLNQDNSAGLDLL